MSSVMQSEHIFSEWGGCLYSWQWPGIQRVQLDKKASPPQHANISPQRASMLGRRSKNLKFFFNTQPKCIGRHSHGNYETGPLSPHRGSCCWFRGRSILAFKWQGRPEMPGRERSCLGNMPWPGQHAMLGMLFTPAVLETYDTRQLMRKMLTFADIWSKLFKQKVS